MAGKINKEMLAKNGFWIGLGGFVFFWLIALVLLLFLTGDDAPRKAYEDAKKQMTDLSRSAKTKEWQKPWNDHGKKYRKKKDDAWELAWNVQKGMYQWPVPMASTFSLYYPEDPWGPNPETDLDRRVDYRGKWYASQFEDLAKIVEPVVFKGGFENVFPQQKWRDGLPPTREECWLAQEDFWIRREMLYIVRNALDSVAELKMIEEKKKDDLPKGVFSWTRWKNADWELDLIVEEETRNPRKGQISMRSKIKNVSQTTLSLSSPNGAQGIYFKLYDANNPDRAPFRMQVTGVPLPPGSESTFPKALTTDIIDLTKPFTVFQDFYWETSPIRRIDRMALGIHSHRTVTAGLKIRPDLKALDPDPAPEVPAGGVPAGPKPVAAGAAAPAPAGAAAPAAPAPPEVTRVNSIPRERYMQVTSQCRHLPIVMCVVLDQGHLHEFLTAVANSRLRIQITQVQESHIETKEVKTDVVQSEPTPMDTVRPGTGPGRPGRPGPRREREDRPRPPILIPGPRPGDQPGVPKDANLQEDNAALVEVTVYGLSSLYERYPPREDAQAAPGTPPPPVTPGPGTPGPGPGVTGAKPPTPPVVPSVPPKK
jgi:hypothetical protein